MRGLWGVGCGFWDEGCARVDIHLHFLLLLFLVQLPLLQVCGVEPFHEASAFGFVGVWLARVDGRPEGRFGVWQQCGSAILRLLVYRGCELPNAVEKMPLSQPPLKYQPSPDNYQPQSKQCQLP